MSRGRYPRRINLGRIDPDQLSRYLLLWDGADLYHHPDSFPFISASALFGKELPLSLDIGCGTGEFLCGLAGQTSDQVFIGLDSAKKPIVRAAVHASQLGLDNVLFIRSDVRLAYSRMLPRSCRAVYLQYPVPGARNRQRKPAIFDDQFLREVVRVLIKGGRLSVVTDRKLAYRAMLQKAMSISELRLLEEDAYELEFTSSLKSHNYRIWSARGHYPLRFEMEKIVESAVRNV